MAGAQEGGRMIGVTRENIPYPREFVVPKDFTEHTRMYCGEELTCSPEEFPMFIAEEFVKGMKGDYSVLGRGRWFFAKVNENDTDPPDTHLGLYWHRGYSDFHTEAYINEDGTPRAVTAAICGETGWTYGSQRIFCSDVRIEELDGRSYLIFERIGYPDLLIPISGTKDRWKIPDQWMHRLCGELIGQGHPVDDDILEIANMMPGWDVLIGKDADIVERAVLEYGISDEALRMVPPRAIPEKIRVQASLGAWM